MPSAGGPSTQPPSRLVTLLFLIIIGVAGCSLTGALVQLARGDAPYSGPVGDASGIGRSRAWFTAQGVYNAEYNRQARRSFSWTERTFAFVIPHLDRSRPHRVLLTVRGGRAAPPLPEASIAVDGIVNAHVPITNDRRTIDVVIPEAPRGAAIVTISLSNDFVPGHGDTRRLGLVIEDVSLAPLAGQRLRWPPWTIGQVLVVVTLYALALVVAGARRWWAMAAQALGAAVLGGLLSVDAAFLGTFVESCVRIASGVTVAGAIVGLVSVATRSRGEAWPTVAALVAGIVGLKLSLFAHPAAMIGDCIFQAHRAQLVHGGTYFFTSITPRPYFEFPYAIGLYVTALPFWGWFPTTMDLVGLLRGLATVVDASVGLAFYFVVRRHWNEPAAVATALVYPFVRTGEQALCTGNLTNVFGQGVFGLAIAAAVWRADRGRAVVSTAAVSALLAYSFLSHFSTASVGVPLAAAVAASMWLANVPRAGRTAAWMLLAVMLATTVSYAVYYSHFTDVYARTVQRVAAREREAERRSMVRPASAKAAYYVELTEANFGPGLLMLAAAGTGLLAARRRRDPLTLALAAWLATTIAFALLGILTAIEMRANLAAQPLVTMLAAYALGACAARFGMIGRAVSLAVTMLIVADGLRSWLICLTRLP